MLDDLTEKMKSCDLGKNLKMGEEDLEQKKERDAQPTNANADEPADVCVKNGQSVILQLGQNTTEEKRQNTKRQNAKVTKYKKTEYK